MVTYSYLHLSDEGRLPWPVSSEKEKLKLKIRSHWSERKLLLKCLLEKIFHLAVALYWMVQWVIVRPRLKSDSLECRRKNPTVTFVLIKIILWTPALPKLHHSSSVEEKERKTFHRRCFLNLFFPFPLEPMFPFPLPAGSPDLKTVKYFKRRNNLRECRRYWRKPSVWIVIPLFYNVPTAPQTATVLS